MNLIITNIGRRGYLVDFIKDISFFSGKVFVSDCDITASGLYGNNDGHFLLPRPSDNEIKYVSELICLCRKQEIDIVIPVIDPEIYILSGYVNELKSNGIRVIVSNRNVLEICFNKKKMNDFLLHYNFALPETYYSITEFERAFNMGEIFFPVIIKPIYGSGSAETYETDNIEKLHSLFHEGMMIQRKIVGDEYGVDIFNSFEGIPLRCVIKKKISMRSGETDKSISVLNRRIKELVLDMALKLGHIANLDCDLIYENKKVYIIDLNPRFGGGYPATHIIGVNLMEILLRLCKGEKVFPCFENYEEGILVMKEISMRRTYLREVDGVETYE